MTDGTMPLTRHEAYEYRRDRSLIVELKGIVARLEKVTPDAHVAVSGWLSYKEHEPTRRPSGHSDPTGAAVVAGEVYDDKLADYRDALQAVVEVAESALTLGQRLTLLGTDKERPHTDPPGVGDCERCGDHCTGYHPQPDGTVKKDNIVQGLCPSCYRAWLRAGKPERYPVALNPERAWDIHGDTLKWRIAWAGDTEQDVA